MSNYYFEKFKKAVQDPKLNVDALLHAIENTDFFIKILRVKLESKDPDLRKQALEELKQFKSLLTELNPNNN